jgi:hypothetical protein
MKRGGFKVDGEGCIDDSGFIVEYPLYFDDVFALDIPKEIFVPRVTIRYAFY